MLKQYPPDPITPAQNYQLLKGNGKFPTWYYDSPSGNIRFHLMGGQAPWPGVQQGVICKSLKSYDPIFEMLDSQGAHQDGVTFNDAVYGPTEFDFILKTTASREQGISGAQDVLDDWLSSWDPKQQGKLTRYTEAEGHWWCNVRKSKALPDDLTVRSRFQQLTWVARNDLTFFQSTPSVCTFHPGGSGGSGFQKLTNRGDQPAWSSHLCYGPGTFAFGDGPGSTTMITFGPLEAGQIVLITTLPRLRSVVDLTPSTVSTSQQNLDLFQTIVKDLETFAFAGNIPPLLEQFNSLLGILPPQGVLYSLLNGRFTNPIPPKPEGAYATESHIAVSITSGTSASKIISSVTPFRRMVVR